MNTIILNCTEDINKTINKASSILKNGGIGIFPTDTVYGIGCDALNTDALKKLYNCKNRNLNKPINVLVSNENMLNRFVRNINDLEKKLIDNFWPGALTIIFDKSDIVPTILNSNLTTVGVRMPANKTCLELINTLNTPIATSSANITNESPANEINEKLLNDFNNKINFIIDEGYINGIPSTIIRVEGNKIHMLREGAISLDDIMKIIEI